MTKKLFKSKITSLPRKELATRVHRALTDCGHEVAFDDVTLSIDVSAQPERGEVALKTFIFSKKYKLTGEVIVSCLHQKWTLLLDFIQEMNADLPYINFSLRYDWIPDEYRHFQTAIENETGEDLGTVVVEHTQPNTHKSLHVGHLRNTVLGDTIYRLLKYFAKRCIAVDYHGDEGAHVTKVVWYIQREDIDLSKIEHEFPEAVQRSEWLGALYAEANKTVELEKEKDKNTVNLELASILRNIEARKGIDYEIWKRTRSWSIEGFRSIYSWLDVSFDANYSESEVSEASQGLVDEYLEKGVFHESDGAIGIDLSDQKLGFSMLRKSDGTGLYATKDVELALRRYRDFSADSCIYIVDQRQSLHFQQVFATVRKMGFEFADSCFHLGYDIVQSKEGAFSSRTGNALSAKELISEMMQKSEVAQSERSYEGSELSTKAVKEVALAAVRYGMLKVDPVKKVTFDSSEWTRFEGDTGPYLLYSYARAKAVMRKADAEGLHPAQTFDSLFFFEELSSEQKQMIYSIMSLKEQMERAASSLKPSQLCTHVFRCCQIFNAQYAKEKVLVEGQTREKSESMLLLYSVFCQFLELNFSILGWEPLDEL